MFESLSLRLERAFSSCLEEMGPRGPLKEACEYALFGGKKVRALWVLAIAEALGAGLDVSDVAFSVECFHAASLIADDLPSMDDDSVRRGRPSLHKAFGEDVALLASYALISIGYEGIVKNQERMKLSPRFASQADQRALICLKTATRCAGLKGATQGQYLDLYPPNQTLETLREIIHKKTGTLFEVSFVFGWVFGGGDLFLLPVVKEAAWHMGMAFQVADDLDDDGQDGEKKSNIVSLLGKEKAKELLAREIDSLKKNLEALHLEEVERFFDLCNQLHRS